MKKHLFAMLGAAALLITACEKNVIRRQDAPVIEGARVKFVHAAPDAPGVDLFVNNTKISGFTPTAAGAPAPIAFGNSFPAPLANYAVVNAGQPTVKLTTPSSGTTAGATVYENTVALEDGKYYSLLITGAGSKPNILVLGDNMPPTDLKFYVRFVNLIPDGPGYDLALRGGATLFQDVKFGTFRSFIAIDPTTNPTFELRQTGTTTAIGAVYTLNSSAAGRVLTLFAQGLNGKTGTQAPKLNAYVNR